MKKQKLTQILLICALVALILVVIITSIVLNYKQKKLDQLERENKKIEDLLPPAKIQSRQDFENIFENIKIFIDK